MKDITDVSTHINAMARGLFLKKRKKNGNSRSPLHFSVFCIFFAVSNRKRESYLIQNPIYKDVLVHSYLEPCSSFRVFIPYMEEDV